MLGIPVAVTVGRGLSGGSDLAVLWRLPARWGGAGLALAMATAGALSARAGFCEQVAVTGGRVTRGDHRSVHRKDRRELVVRSQRTESRMVQMADIALLFRIPEGVPLAEVAGMQITITAGASMPHVLAMVEAWDNGKKRWTALDTLRLEMLCSSMDVGVKDPEPYLDRTERTFRLRLRTKKETADAYYVKIDAIKLMGIRAEGMEHYGDLFEAVAGNDGEDGFEKKLKKLKDDWDLSFAKGGRIIPIKDWESSEERKENLKKTWRRSWDKDGKVITMESQLR